LYNGRHHPGESIRVFLSSKSTALDVRHYIAQERLALPSIITPTSARSTSATACSTR
jgi:hypothetical protein